MSDAERLAQIRARHADVSDTPYSMYDFGPLGCTVGDAYFFGDAREDVGWLLSRVITPEQQSRLDALSGWESALYASWSASGKWSRGEITWEELQPFHQAARDGLRPVETLLCDQRRDTAAPEAV